jgi:hypothetical protein
MTKCRCLYALEGGYMAGFIQKRIERRTGVWGWNEQTIYQVWTWQGYSPWTANVEMLVIEFCTFILPYIAFRTTVGEFSHHMVDVTALKAM